MYRDEIHSFPATRLMLGKTCRGPFELGIFDATRESVRLSFPKNPAPTNLQSLNRDARKLIAEPADDMYRVSEDAPIVLTANAATVFAFKLKTNDKGPAVLLLNGKLHVLQGWCTTHHEFLTVNDKLHLIYYESGCDSGVYVLYVYDLSTGTPIQVYSNGRLGT